MEPQGTAAWVCLTNLRPKFGLVSRDSFQLITGYWTPPSCVTTTPAPTTPGSTTTTTVADTGALYRSETCREV